MLAFEPHISKSQRKCLLLLLTAYVYIFKNEKWVFDLVWGLSSICRNVDMIFFHSVTLFCWQSPLLGCILFASMSPTWLWWILPGGSYPLLLRQILPRVALLWSALLGGLCCRVFCWLWIHTTETLIQLLAVLLCFSFILLLSTLLDPFCCWTVSCQGHWVQGWLSRCFTFIFFLFVWFFWLFWGAYHTSLK